jgi:hypothetical protein
MSEANRMSEHLAASLLRATSGFVHPFRFDLLELDQQVDAVISTIGVSPSFGKTKVSSIHFVFL